MGKMWSSQSHWNNHFNDLASSAVIDSGGMLEREPSVERLTQLREENTSLKKTTNHQEDTIRQLRTKLSRVIALAKRAASSDVQTVTQIRYHEDSLRQLPNGTSTPHVDGVGTSSPGAAPTGTLPANARPQSSVIRARSASRGRMGLTSARSRSRPSGNGTVDGISLGLLEEAHNEICALKAEVKRREEEVREWETVAQKLNCELSSERKLRSEAEQEVSRVRVSLVKAHKELQIKDTQVEALEAEMEACRLVRDKVDVQSAKLLDLEQAMAQRDSQSTLLQELQQRIGELEHERDIVEDSNRKLVRQSEELKERMAAQEQNRLQQQSGPSEGRVGSGLAQHDSGVHALSDEDLTGSVLLQDMLLQLQDKFEKLEQHIDKVVDDARRSRPKSSRTPRESTNRDGRAAGSTRDSVDKDARKERLGTTERPERPRTSRDSRDGQGRSEPRNSNEPDGIYSSDSPRRSLQKNTRALSQPESKRRPHSGLPTSNGSSIPLPKPRRRLLSREQQPTSVEGSMSSCHDSPDEDNRDDSLLNGSNNANTQLRSRPRTALGHRRAALVRNEATQTNRSEQKDSPTSPHPAGTLHTSSRIKQTTKILSSDDSISEMTELSLADSTSPHFEIHIDKARFSEVQGHSLQALAKRNIVVTWELADFEVQSTPVGHLCKEDDELVFNCTARYILETEGQLDGAKLQMQVATADGEVLGECVLDVAQLQKVIKEPRRKRGHSANLELDRMTVGILDLWLRYIPRPD